jgi:hypothetical protein
MDLPQPIHPLFSACSFLAVSAVTWPGGETTFASGIAPDYFQIEGALIRCLFGIFTPSEEELAPIKTFIRSIGNRELWIANEITDAPLFLEATFEYGEDQPALTLRLIALCDLVPASLEPVPLPEETLADPYALYQAHEASRKFRAEENFNIPFFGHADAQTFAAITDAILNSDCSEITRTTKQGEYGDLSVAYAFESTNPEDIIEVEIIYDVVIDKQVSQDVISEILGLFHAFDEVNSRKVAAGLLYVTVQGKKREVQSVLDWSSDYFVSLRTHGHDNV